MTIEIAGLWISPGHNFFGRHGETALNHPAVPVEQIECVAGRGVRRDRFFDYRPDYKGQITFVAMETLERIQQILKLESIPPGATRRNVHTRGVDLNALIGATFELGGLKFQGTEECRPCEWMNQAIAPGAEDLLRGHGGLRAKILSDGILRVGTSDLRT
jgi:MOSC domain-containing protein YiiM